MASLYHDDTETRSTETKFPSFSRYLSGSGGCGSFTKTLGDDTKEKYMSNVDGNNTVEEDNKNGNVRSNTPSRRMLSQEEYKKLKQIGHFFPCEGVEETSDDDDDDDDDDEASSSECSAKIESEKGEEENPHRRQESEGLQNFQEVGQSVFEQQPKTSKHQHALKSCEEQLEEFPYPERTDNDGAPNCSRIKSKREGDTVLDTATKLNKRRRTSRTNDDKEDNSSFLDDNVHVHGDESDDNDDNFHVRGDESDNNVHVHGDESDDYIHPDESNDNESVNCYNNDASIYPENDEQSDECSHCSEEEGSSLSDESASSTKPHVSKRSNMKWNERVKKLAEYHKQYGTWMVDPKVNKKLSRWTANVRHQYGAMMEVERREQHEENGNAEQDESSPSGNERRKKPFTLSVECYEQLCNIGYEFPSYTCEDDNETKWNKCFNQVHEYYQQYGSWVHKHHPELRRWIQRQIAMYKGMKNGRDSSAAMRMRYNKLLQIGFPFTATTKLTKKEVHWNERFDELVQYHKKYGTWTIDSEINPRLATWERNVEGQYRAKIRKEQKIRTDYRPQDILRDDRYERLLSVGYEFPPIPPNGGKMKIRKSPGTRVWKAIPMKSWNERLTDLVQYHQEHGSWRVDKKLDFNLHNWERHMRQTYRNRLRIQQRKERMEKKEQQETEDGTDSDNELSDSSSSASHPTPHKRRKKLHNCKILSDDRYQQLCEVGYELPTRETQGGGCCRSIKCFDRDMDCFDRSIKLYLEYKSKYELLPSFYMKKFNSVDTKWCVNRKVENGKYIPLARWIKTQRKSYMYRLDKEAKRGLFSIENAASYKRPNPPPLSDERYHKLCQVGFVFPDIKYYQNLKENNKIASYHLKKFEKS